MGTYYHASLKERKIVESYKSLAPWEWMAFDDLEDAKSMIKNSEVEFKKMRNRVYDDYELTEVEIKLLKRK